MPPIKNNPKFLKHRQIAEEKGIDEANRRLSTEWKAEANTELTSFANWVNVPQRLYSALGGAISFIIVGGLVYYVYNNPIKHSGKKKNMIK